MCEMSENELASGIAFSIFKENKYGNIENVWLPNVP